MPEVSVVMAVYNGERHLASTVDSVTSQTGVQLELIVIDDGSSDATPAILDDLAARDDRIRAIHQQNAGITRSLIRGCADARAPLIARQDCGDLSLPGRLQAQKDAFDRNDVLVFASCWTEYAGPELEPLFRTCGSGRAAEPVQVLQGTEMIDGPTHHGSVMFRRDAYERAGGYRAQFYYGQDWDLWYRLAQLGSFVVVPEVLYRARIEPRSLSSAAKPEQERIAAYSRGALEARLRGESEEPWLASAAAVSRARRRSGEAPGLYFIGEALRRNGDSRAVAYLAASLRESPWRLRTLIRYLQSRWQFRS